MPVPSRLALSSKAFSNEEIFGMKLKNYLIKTTSRPSKELSMDLALEIDHPQRVISSTLISDDHPLKEEAWTISDCFEALTNGMENPEAMVRLNFIQEHSPFYYWKLLIHCVLDFYQGKPDFEKLSSIPSAMPMTPMIEVLKALNRQDDKTLDERSKKLFQKVLAKDPKVLTLLEEVLDGLDTGMEDLVWSASEELIELLMDACPDSAKSFGLWLVSQIESQDFDPGPLASLFQFTFGTIEGCRLLALGLLPSDPEGAVLYWLQFLILVEEEKSLSTQKKNASVELFHDFCLATLDHQKDEGRDEEFIRSFENLLNRMPEAWRKTIFKYDSWSDFEKSKKAKTPPINTETRKQTGSDPRQFDLFAS